MTYIINNIGDGKCSIDVDFRDEGVDLQGRTSVIGDESKAAQYALVFEADLRQANSHLFPREESNNHELTEA